MLRPQAEQRRTREGAAFFFGASRKTVIRPSPNPMPTGLASALATGRGESPLCNTRSHAGGVVDRSANGELRAVALRLRRHD
jgi:hypothetical protein